MTGLIGGFGPVSGLESEHRVLQRAHGCVEDERRLVHERRTRYLENEGIRLIRFWNNDVLAHTDAVLETILHALLRATGDRGSDGR